MPTNDRMPDLSQPVVGIEDLEAVEPRSIPLLRWVLEPCTQRSCHEWQLMVLPFAEPIPGWALAEYMVHGYELFEVSGDEYFDGCLEVRKWLERLHADG